jgi:hypothetical protein
MSEQHRLPEGNEHMLTAEAKSSEEHKGALAKSEGLKPHEITHGNNEQVETHRSKVEQHSISGKETSHFAAENEQPKNTHPLIASLQLKTAAWSRQMTRTRKRLNPLDRAASKLIHSPIVDKPSEFIGKTIARPQGMLWGSVVAFIGTSVLLWTTNYYGYRFNYLLVILLFLGGSLLGAAIEGLNYAFRKKRK